MRVAIAVDGHAGACTAALHLAWAAFATGASLALVAGVGWSQTRTDSAGVQIVELATLATSSITYRIEERPLLQLGGLRSDPDAEFDPRHALLRTLRLPDGRVVVNDYTTLKVFGPQGRVLRTIGRSGSGPGEFQQTRGVCRADGDTLIAFDFALRRASVFTTDGAFVRTVVTDSRPVPLGSGCFGDGSVVMFANARPNPASMLPPDRARRLDRVADFRRIATARRDVTALGTWPVDPVSPFIAPLTVQVVDDVIFVGDSHRREVRQHDGQGRLTRVIRWQAPRTRITPALIEQLVRARTAPSTPRSVIDQQMQAYRASPLPDELPGFLQMLVDPLQRVWLEDYPISARSDTWTVLSREGAVLGRVRIPRPPGIGDRSLSELVEVLEDRVALRWRDQDGAVHLTYHAITAAP